MKDKIAILIVSHNNPTLTDNLCESIIARTEGVDYDLHVIETGSNLTKVSKYMTLWVKDGVRMTRGFNLLKHYADFTAKQNGYSYDAYHLFVNDAKVIDDQDIVSILWEEMKMNPDCGYINPYQVNIPAPHIRQNKMRKSGSRKESFSEIICPMIRAKAWEDIPELLDNRFYYGWGLDYDIPHLLHTNNWRLYISDTVGIYHTAFTSYTERHTTEEKMDVSQFMNVALRDLLNGFREKYGADWKKTVMESIPSDVNPEAYYLWLLQCP
jgi:hypothetical protein